jgi:predicted DNA binding CopG/RHH family protein
VLVIGEMGKFMSNQNIKYTDETLGKINIIHDFLSSPEELMVKEETVKVTLALTKESVEFFKITAHEQHVHYQTMIRTLLDQYSKHFRKKQPRAKP